MKIVDDGTHSLLIPIPVLSLKTISKHSNLRLVVDVKHPDHLLFETDAIIGFIAMRPPMCDRGRWLLNADSKDSRILTIDHADRFPRYYFNDTSLCVELKAWLHARGQLMSMRTEPKRWTGL